MAGIVPDGFAESALSAVRKFGTALHALAVGDENLRIGPESDAAILDHLGGGKYIWSVFGPASQQIAALDLHTMSMPQFLNYGSEMKEHAQALTMTSIDAHGATIDKTLATTSRL